MSEKKSIFINRRFIQIMKAKILFSDNFKDKIMKTWLNSYLIVLLDSINY